MEARERNVRYLVVGPAAPFQDWRNSLSDARAKAAVDARVARLRSGNFGDSKPIGTGASESRVDFGPGYRIYYGADGDDLILICGGTKATQAADIQHAKALWKRYKEDRRRVRE